MESKGEHAKKELSLGLWEKFLTLGIALCIVVGLLLGKFFPAIGEFMDALKFAQLSMPIGILLFLCCTIFPVLFGHKAS